MEHARNSISAAILAGGRARRLGGEGKALLDLDGRPLVRHVADALSAIFDEVFLVAREPGPLAGLGLRVAADRFDTRAALTGIHAALDAADTEQVFIAACDTPFLQPTLVRALAKLADGGPDVILPRRDGWFWYPLCGIWSRGCLPVIERHLDEGSTSVADCLSELDTLSVPLERLLPYDPTLRSLVNVNTAQDLASAREMLAPVR
jgi:molybdopterin-guanine dinucleotide biosynthesis protein A